MRAPLLAPECFGQVMDALATAPRYRDSGIVEIVLPFSLSPRFGVDLNAHGDLVRPQDTSSGPVSSGRSHH
ncbi:hypothetical protein AF71_00016830 [Rhizobium sp. 57MFTsu3.2]|nr:hypothetical protein [Rhizobium sp. 57MFTsu3.2]